METMTALCGIKCSECPAFIAYKNNNQELRIKTAGEWSQMFKNDFKPEDINCVGCTPTQGVHVGYCSMCEIRTCGLQKNIATCAHCSDYACEKLVKFLEMAPASAKKTLEEMRAKLRVNR